MSPVEVAVAYIEAFGQGDMATAAQYVAEDIVFQSPMTRITGSEPYLAAVGEFARAVIGVDIVAAIGDAESAMVMYDMRTGPFGTVPAADHFVVRDGRITSNRLVLDTYDLRSGRA